MPGLDALRGLAVLLVILYHGLYWTIPDGASAVDVSKVRHLTAPFVFGWSGVNLFFVLSGFLITGILLDTRTQPNFWKNFYTRRLLRIMPLLVLILFSLWLFVPGYTWQYVVACFFYLGNLTKALGVPGSSYGVLWSLAVEEQFYLVWPFLAKWLSRRWFAAVSIACVVTMPLLRYVSEANGGFLGDSHGMTWLIADNLAAGACMAVLLRTDWATTARIRTIAWTLFVFGMVFFGVAAKLDWLHRSNPVGSALQVCPLIAIYTAFLLFSLIVGDRPLVLKITSPLRWLGYISYGLYLYHMLVFNVFDVLEMKMGRRSNEVLTIRYMLVRFVVCFVGSLIVSYFSRRYFEDFFLRLKDRKAKYFRQAAIAS